MDNILANNTNTDLAQTFQASINDFFASSTRAHFKELFRKLVNSK